MASFIIRRVLSTLVVLFLVSIIAFLLLRVSPGDPARQILGPQASAKAVEELREEMGVDEPLPQQYANYTGDLLEGNFGFSWRTRVSVGDELANRLPASIELAVLALIISCVVGIPLGLLAAGGNRWTDRISRGFAVIGLGTPPFWLGLVLILLFFTWLDLVPAPIGRLDDSILPPAESTGFLTIDSIIAGRPDAFGNSMLHLLLPALTLGLPLAAYLSRIVRRSTADVYRLDFIRTARAKGASEKRVMYRHALPNALLPVLTLSALYFGELIAGSLVVEAVFAWPGVGGWVAESILSQDFAPVQGAIILGALAYCMLNLTADILYGFADPRIRLSK